MSKSSVIHTILFLGIFRFGVAATQALPLQGFFATQFAVRQAWRLQGLLLGQGSQEGRGHFVSFDVGAVGLSKVS